MFLESPEVGESEFVEQEKVLRAEAEADEAMALNRQDAEDNMAWMAHHSVMEVA